MTTSVLTEIQSDGVARICLNRAERHNAFDDETIALLTRTLQEMDANSSVRIIRLEANGKSFCAGADLNWMKKMANYDREQNYADSVELATLMHTLYQCSKPTIAVCQGAAFGGGVGLVACCDMVIAAETAKFCLSEVKLGLIPAVISPFVVKAIGARQARRYFVSAEIFSAEQAKSMNLVHEVVAMDDLAKAADKWCERVLANGPLAMREAKLLISEVCDASIDENLLQHTANRITDIRASDEGKEGISAFLEKRTPHWQSPLKG